MLPTMGNTIEVNHADWFELRREAKFRGILHKRSMQREAELEEQLRDTKQQLVGRNSEQRKNEDKKESEQADGAPPKPQRPGQKTIKAKPRSAARHRRARPTAAPRITDHRDDSRAAS